MPPCLPAPPLRKADPTTTAVVKAVVDVVAGAVDVVATVVDGVTVVVVTGVATDDVVGGSGGAVSLLEIVVMSTSAESETETPIAHPISTPISTRTRPTTALGVPGRPPSELSIAEGGPPPAMKGRISLGGSPIGNAPLNSAVRDRQAACRAIGHGDSESRMPPAAYCVEPFAGYHPAKPTGQAASEGPEEAVVAPTGFEPALPA